MHELGISRNIVAIVGDAAGGRRVRRVTIEIGRLSGVMPEALLFCFDLVAQGTMLEGASLEIKEIEPWMRCTTCAAEFAAAGYGVACACGSRRLAPLAGEELNIKAMELEEVA
jgi:hydrogenase nickel incorporation protein HypA/HybF